MRVACYIFCLCLSLFVGTLSYAQESVHVIVAEKSSKKVPLSQKWANFREDVTLAPHYSSSMGAGVAFAYTPADNFSFVGNIATKGYTLLGINGRKALGKGKWEFNYNAFYCFAPIYSWGVGYSSCNDDANKERFYKRYLNLQGEFLFRPGNGVYTGPSVGYEHLSWDKLDPANYFNMGYTIGYDSRDNAAAPARGIHAVAQQKYFIKSYGATSLTFDAYCPLWGGGVLAFDFHSEFAYSNVPWYAMPSIGGSYRMRGYYKGRYRDNNMVTAQMELRQHIWDFVGAAAWVGAGNVWGKGGAFSLRHTLPNYGVGVRVKIGASMSLRLDYGFGKKGQSGFILGINEAF